MTALASGAAGAGTTGSTATTSTPSGDNGGGLTSTINAPNTTAMADAQAPSRAVTSNPVADREAFDRNADAQMDAALAKLSQPEQDDDTAEGQTGEPEQAAESTTGARTQAATPEATTSVGGLTADQARAALKRWQWPDDVIAALPEAVLMERGAVARRSQQEADRVASDRAVLSQRLAEMGIVPPQGQQPANQPAGGVPGEPNTGQAEGQAQPAAAGAQGEDPYSELAKTLKADEFFADAADPLVKTLRAVGQGQEQKFNQFSQGTVQAIGQLQGMIQQQVTPQINHLYNVVERLNLELTRRDLQAKPEYEALKDQTKFTAVDKRMRAMAQLPGYHDQNGVPDLAKLMGDAALIEFGPETLQSTQQKLVTRFQAQTKGQPSPPRDANRPPGSLTEDQKLDYATKRLNAGATPEQVQRELARAG